VDTTGPQITVSSPDDGYLTQDNRVLIAYSLSEQASTLVVEYDGVNGTQNISNACIGLSCTLNRTGIPDGTHTYRVYATDVYGNTGHSMQRTFTVAYAPPECRAPSSGSWTLTGNCNLKNMAYELQNRSVQIRDGANASFENCTFKLGLHGSFTAENATSPCFRRAG